MKGKKKGTKKCNLVDTINQFNKIHNNKYNYLLFTSYINNKQMIDIICPHHGIFPQRIDMHKRGQGCPHCKAKKIGDIKRHDILILIERMKEIHNNFFDYSLIKDYYTVDDNIDVICPKHGIFQTTAHRHLKGAGCLKCYNEIRGISCRSTLDEFIKKAKLVYDDFYGYEKSIYINSKKLIEITCPYHGSFFKKPNNHLMGEGCPYCFSSKGEKKIFAILSGNDIKFNRQKSFNGCKYKNLLRFDFYLPEFNTCIEYNGEQHFKIPKNWGGEKEQNENIKRDKIKIDFCINNNIRLISIPYFEFDNIYNIIKKELNINLIDFKEINEIYPTYEESKNIVKEININSQKEYRTMYKSDNRLPSHPESTYKNSGWISWYNFLDKEKK